MTTRGPYKSSKKLTFEAMNAHHKMHITGLGLGVGEVRERQLQLREVRVDVAPEGGRDEHMLLELLLQHHKGHGARREGVH